MNKLDLKDRKQRNFAKKWERICKRDLIKSSEGFINPALTTLTYVELNELRKINPN